MRKVNATGKIKDTARLREHPPMRDYHVVWSIDLYDVSAVEAAKTARRIQLDPDNIATHFTVDGKDVDVLQEQVRLWVDKAFRENRR